MSIAKDFTWSDTPTSEMSSGSNANARKILLVQRVAFRIHVTLMVCHALHLIVRMATNTDNTLYFNTWIPFGDKTKLAYGVVLIVQVHAVLYFVYKTGGFHRGESSDSGLLDYNAV
jgi:hypothetical protein